MTDLHFYTADTLARLERYPEAERHFRQEIRLFPQSVRARAGLAMLYRAQGRDAESDRAIEDMLRTSPTAEAHDMAAQLWTMFGQPQKAAEARAAIKRASR
jgi:tetratricopeptide (TPR) repeat protein